MFGKLALALAIGLTLVQAPIPGSAAKCCAEPASHQPSLLDGCCAPTACCVISAADENPVTPASATSQLEAAPAVVSLATPISFPASPRELGFAKAPTVAHSPPPFALLCTRLI